MADRDESHSDASTIKRRVYDLPVDLVDRILAYQKNKNLPSEVEAVRRLLDSALKESDTLTDLLIQLAIRLDNYEDPNIAAVAVLAGHPKVASMDFVDDHISFRFRDKKSDRHVIMYSKLDIRFSDDNSVYALLPKGPGGRLILVGPDETQPY